MSVPGRFRRYTPGRVAAVGVGLALVALFGPPFTASQYVAGIAGLVFAAGAAAVGMQRRGEG